jgi:SH3-like domain-containing protein
MPRKSVFAEIALIAALVAGGQNYSTLAFLESAAAAPGLADGPSGMSPRLQERMGAGLQIAQSRPVDPNNPAGARVRPRPVDPDSQGGARLRPEPGASTPTGDRIERAAPPLSPPASPVPGYRVIGVDANDVLNIRSGPDANSAIVGTIPPNGTNVRMIGSCAGPWCQIEYRGTQGWANRRFLTGE